MSAAVTPRFQACSARVLSLLGGIRAAAGRVSAGVAAAGSVGRDAVGVSADVASAGVAAYKQGHATLHDLSVVGNGVPSVVQIHDPGCRLCQALKSNAQGAMGKFEGQLNYRLSNIRTKPGRTLARRYDVPHVTLLFFDGEGKHTRTTSGVLEEDTLEHLFAAHVSKYGKRPAKAEG